MKSDHALSKNRGEEVVEQLLSLLRHHPQIKEICHKFGLAIDTIDELNVKFKKMNVSAKTKNGIIYLNESFLENGELAEEAPYIVHEFVHYCQQRTGLAKYHQPDHYKNYLDLPTEIQAFREQIRFIADYKGKEAAQKYLDELLDFHELKGADRKEKSEQLGGDWMKTAAPNHVQISVSDSEGRQLQHRYLKRDHWAPPAGRIERGEKPKDAAQRELQERTGFAAEKDDLRPVGETEEFYEFEADFEDLKQVDEPQTEIRLVK